MKSSEQEFPDKLLNSYSPLEEKWNILSHAVGLGLSFIALALLIVRTLRSDDSSQLLSFVIFGVSMILLYAASTFYHSAKEERLRFKLKILDHAAIYVLIAGTYTPFALVTLGGSIGWIIFALVWTLAILGVILKFFFTGRYTTLSTIMYVLMGWIIIFVAKPLSENLPMEGVYWVVAGGLSYTLGAVIYSLRKIKFNHAIFHFFVLGGTFCHFISIYSYVLPAEG